MGHTVENLLLNTSDKLILELGVVHPSCIPAEAIWLGQISSEALGGWRWPSTPHDCSNPFAVVAGTFVAATVRFHAHARTKARCTTCKAWKLPDMRAAHVTQTTDKAAKSHVAKHSHCHKFQTVFEVGQLPWMLTECVAVDDTPDMIRSFVAILVGGISSSLVLAASTFGLIHVIRRSHDEDLRRAKREAAQIEVARLMHERTVNYAAHEVCEHHLI